MSDRNAVNQCDIGMIGLGTMGRNLLLNMADHGFTVAGYDLDKNKVDSLQKEAQQKNVYGESDLTTFIKLLKKPCAIMLLVPAGAPVDAVINSIVPHLQAGDLIIDGGNSHFTDTDRRARELEKKDIQFLGVGISGGEEGARLGPSMMPGGDRAAYERVRPIFEAVAAKVNGDPCVTYLGKGSAGHYVKMVHNGIEYAIMQLIAESYDLMKHGLGLNDQQLHDVYAKWNEGKLNSYLIEITSHIFSKIDERTHQPLINEIVAVADQTGTGMWTSQSAMELQVPIPSIDLAVAMRDMSVLVKQREQAQKLYPRNIPLLSVDRFKFINELENALFTGMILAYAQGMALLNVASQKYNYQLDLEAVARIWRGGCIIRAKLLEDIRQAFHANKNLINLLLDANLAKKINQGEQNLRQIICQTSLIAVPMPAHMVSLSYLDAYRSVWTPANLIQAQRDYFGAHQYARKDSEGKFHTEWERNLT